MSDLKLSLQTANKGTLALQEAFQNVQDYLPVGIQEKVGAVVPQLSSYQWFSQANLERARGWYEAAAAALASGKYEQITLCLCQLADVWHFDRAEAAVALTRRKERPIRRAEIPPHLFRNGQTFHLQLLQPSHDSHFPMPLHTAITNVLRRMPADELWLADYVLLYHGTSADPILYARYGDWYVRLAEWE